MRNFLLTALLLLSCAPALRVSHEYYVRVLIFEGDSATLSGKYTLQVGDKSIKISDCVIRGDGIYSSGKLVMRISSAVEFIPCSRLIINNLPYRGTLIVVNTGEKNLFINKVHVEDYLKSVVSCELRTNEIEALKAQAVCARSYALAVKRNKYYDLVNTQTDQVYGGMSKENELAIRAVNETRGEVLMYGNKIIPAFYSACCGGRTRRGNKPYLRSVTCKFCSWSPNYSWRVEYRLKEIEKKLGYGIKRIIIKRKDRYGRVEEMEIIDEHGKSHKLNELEMRSVFNLKSNWFKLKISGHRVRFIGHGYGHGYGLCQSGAVGMARAGYNYRRILRHYFKGTRLHKLY